MTKPMPVLPNTTYMESRRCSERRFFLKPDKTTNQIVQYCTALAAERFGIDLHALMAESNHKHLIFTDRQGNGPAFRQYKNSLIARAANTRLRRTGSFWSTAEKDVVALTDRGAQIDAIAYALSNPVKDGLVKYGFQWPGVRSRPQDIGETKLIKRPKVFFDDKTLPESVRLTLKILPTLDHHPESFAKRQIEEAILAKEKKYRDAQLKSKKRFLGRRNVRRQNPFDAPKTKAPFRKLNPAIKCADPKLRRKAILMLKQFWRAYYDALSAFRAGYNNVIFPLGTYRYRIVLDVPCVSSVPP